MHLTHGILGFNESGIIATVISFYSYCGVHVCTRAVTVEQMMSCKSPSPPLLICVPVS